MTTRARVCPTALTCALADTTARLSTSAANADLETRELDEPAR